MLTQKCKQVNQDAEKNGSIAKKVLPATKAPRHKQLILKGKDRYFPSRNMTA